MANPIRKIEVQIVRRGNQLWQIVKTIRGGSVSTTSKRIY